MMAASISKTITAAPDPMEKLISKSAVSHSPKMKQNHIVRKAIDAHAKAWTALALLATEFARLIAADRPLVVALKELHNSSSSVQRIQRGLQHFQFKELGVKLMPRNSSTITLMPLMLQWALYIEVSLDETGLLDFAAFRKSVFKELHAKRLGEAYRTRVHFNEVERRMTSHPNSYDRFVLSGWKPGCVVPESLLQ